jgi:hypothetical protein
VEVAGTAGSSTGNFRFTITNPDSGSARSSNSAFQVS